MPIVMYARRPCGLMDKALVFGTKDCRFESCQGHSVVTTPSAGCFGLPFGFQTAKHSCLPSFTSAETASDLACASIGQLVEHALRKRTVAGSIRIRGLASLFLNGLLDKGTHSWPGIDSHLEVPVYGALAEHCEVSLLRARALPVRVHLGMDCAISL